MTPFIDVMLVLLIIFMVAAPLITGAIPLDLPVAPGSPPVQQTKPVVVNVGAGGESMTCNTGLATIGDRNVSPQNLVEVVKASIERPGTDDRIIINAGRIACYESVIQLLGTLRDAGFSKVQLNVQPPAN